MWFTDQDNITITLTPENVKKISVYAVCTDYPSKSNIMQIQFDIYSLVTKIRLYLHKHLQKT